MNNNSKSNLVPITLTANKNSSNIISPLGSIERKQSEQSIFRDCQIDKNNSDLGIHTKK